MKTLLKFLISFVIPIVKISLKNGNVSKRISLIIILIIISYADAIAQTPVSVCEGNSLTLTVTAENARQNRQWQVSSNGLNFTNIAGQTGLSYTFIPTTSDNGKQYRVLHTNNGGQQTLSEVFKLNVIQLPLPTVDNPNTQRYGSGPVTFTASGANSGEIYKWFDADGIAIDGATQESYTVVLDSYDTVREYTFYVAIVNSFGCETSTENRVKVTATVNPPTGTIVANNVTNSKLISNTDDGAKSIDALSATYPNNPDVSLNTISYRIETIPQSSQGVLYKNGTDTLSVGNIVTTDEAKGLTFDPNPNFYGTASFTYKAIDQDGNISANTATYYIPVNAAPVANNVSSQNIATTDITQLTYPLSATDQGGYITGYKLMSVPSGGTLYYKDETGNNVAFTSTNINTITLTPSQASQLSFKRTNGGSKGEIPFRYIALDNNGVSSNEATYTIYAEQTPPPPAVPNATNITTQPILNSAPVTPITALNATGSTVQRYQISSLPAASQGKLYIDDVLANITTEYTPTQASKLTFVPEPTFYGTASFTFTATSSINTPREYDPTPATYSIPIREAPKAENISNADVSNQETDPIPINPLSATDADGTISTFTITSLPNSGTLYKDGVVVPNNSTFTAIDGQLSGLTYKPISTFLGDISFTFKATDNEGYVSSNTGTYSFKVSNITPLPITLINFSARAQQYGVELNWATASEINNEHFLIERSADGKSFEEIGKVKGAGNSNQKITYIFNDLNPLPGTSYYRLKQVDFGGKFEYSKIVSATVNQVYEIKVQAHPNPFRYSTTLSLVAVQNEPAILVILDARGVEVKRETVQLNKGMNDLIVTLPLSSRKAGLYFVTVTGGSTRVSVKVLKEQ